MPRPATQPDLFAPAPEAPAPRPPLEAEDAARIRARLDAMLTLATNAPRLPWRNYTVSTLAEMEFDSLANRLPEPESSTRKQAFADQLDRLYALEPQPAPPG